VEVTRVAVPVIVTEKGVVVATLPLKVTRSVNFAPPVKETGLVANATVRPVPPVITDESVTGPANPAEFTVAETPEGRLPIVSVSDAELPEANVTVGPVGDPLEVVTLKFCGRTLMETVWVLVNVPTVA